MSPLHRLVHHLCCLAALLSTGAATCSPLGTPIDAPVPSVKLSPRVRMSKPTDLSIPALPAGAIEPFLAEVLLIDPADYARAPRIVATQEGRVLLSRGDRAYARSSYSGKEDDSTPALLLTLIPGQANNFRIFRSAQPLPDPSTGEVLGYEAQHIGRAQLIRAESRVQVTDRQGDLSSEVIPATLDIISAKEEIRVGDRLLPEPQRQLQNYKPHAPKDKVEGQIISTYGNTASFAAENQVVALNRGSLDGLESGHVLAVVKAGAHLNDSTDAATPLLSLPQERNGLLLVFRTFERVSYALVLQMTDAVKTGDRFINPN